MIRLLHEQGHGAESAYIPSSNYSYLCMCTPLLIVPSLLAHTSDTGMVPSFPPASPSHFLFLLTSSSCLHLVPPYDTSCLPLPSCSSPSSQHIHPTSPITFSP